ncbi:MAG: NAD(P)-binding protein [Coriobacteriia bacterium]|nr:NAD(P)-binding protein [Coriobacteriia bacterium]
MKIAVVGAGVAGVGAAWLLSPSHTVDVYEAEARLGGHAATLDVTVGGVTFPADTGFQVYNTRTYPNLIRFFEALGIEWIETDMSFSVRVGSENVEWSGTSLNTVFAQRGNIVNPKFLAMLADIVRFSHDADRLLADPAIDDITLAEMVEREGYSATFTDWYLIPMGSAIWSTPPDLLRDYPAGTFLRFCDNHGLLHITGKPMWRSVVGGSRTYVEAAAKSFSGSVFAGEPVRCVERLAGGGARVSTDAGSLDYDAVILAAHAPDSLAMLGDASPLEREILGAFGFQPNEIALHTDEAFMPNSTRAWASWNWFAETTECSKDLLTLTYWLNNLQQMPDEAPQVFETLNPHQEYAEGSVLERVTFDHPLFSAEAVAAQKRLPEIQGEGGVWYAGAWQRYGFHEDGLLSAVRVAEALGATLPWGDELDETRTKVLGEPARKSPLL